MNDSNFIQKIQNKSLMKLHSCFEKLFVEKGTVTFLSAGEYICKEGEKLENLYIPIDDSLKLIKEGIGLQGQVVGYLQVGRTLALRHIIADSFVPYSVVSETPSSILQIPRKEFLDTIENVDGLAEYLNLMSLNSGIREFKRYLESIEIDFTTICKIIKEVDLKVIKTEIQKSYVIKNKILFCARGEYKLKSRDKEYFLGESSWWGAEIFIDNQSEYKLMSYKPTYFHQLNAEMLKKYLTVEQIDLISKESFLQRFIKKRNLTKMKIKEFEAPLSAQEKKLANNYVDESHLIQTIYFEEYLEVFAKNFSFLSGIDFNYTCFNLLRDKTSPTVGEAAAVFEGLGFEASQKVYSNETKFIFEYKNRLLIHVVDCSNKFIFWDSISGFLSIEKNKVKTILCIEKPEFENYQEDLSIYNIRSLIQKIVPDQNYYLASMSLLAILVVVFDFIIPQITEFLIDEVLPTKNLDNLVVSIAGLFICTVFNLTFSTFTNIVASVYAGKIESSLFGKFYLKILNLPIKTLNRFKIGGILNRIGDLENIREFFIQEFLVISQGTVKLVLSIGILFYYGWQIAIVALLLIPVSVLLRLLFREHIKRNLDNAFEVSSKNQSLITEILSAIVTVKSSGSEKSLQARWEKLAVSTVQINEEGELLSEKLRQAISLTSQLIQILCIWFAVGLALKGTLSPGSIIAVSMYLAMMMNSIESLAGLISNFEQILLSISKMSDITKVQPEEPYEKARSSHCPVLEGRIQFSRVSFRYQEHLPWVLNDLDFTIFPNQTVAIVGKSGCGKTTLAKLMVGLVTPSSGRILYDQYDSCFLSLKGLRQQIGFLPQHNHLFAGTIKSNISFNSDIPNPTLIQKVSEQAYAKEFISKFPTQFDQYLAEGGLGISGGQRQKLALARMLYNDPKLIVMDESTSALDGESEKAILDTIDKSLQNKTVIIIAHRLSTIKNADHILVMDEGRIVEQGTHASLLRERGFYYSLFEKQISLGDSL